MNNIWFWAHAIMWISASIIDVNNTIFKRNYPSCLFIAIGGSFLLGIFYLIIRG
ncbi:MAG: hypothetical protein ACFFDY_01470 [Candidatus Thorarchaeota archaeon]